MINSYKSIHYPEVIHPLILSQKYAGTAYLWFTIAFFVFVFYRISFGLDILFSGISGIFLTIIMSNVYSVIRMRKTITEVGFYNGNFYINNVYDIVRNHESLLFPLHYANPKTVDEGLLIHYFGRVFQLNKTDWDEKNWNGMLDEFMK